LSSSERERSETSELLSIVEKKAVDIKFNPSPAPASVALEIPFSR
jgi:hypothetical protein